MTGGIFVSAPITEPPAQMEPDMSRTATQDLRCAVREFVRAVPNTGDDATGREIVRRAIRLVRMRIEATGSLSNGISRLYSDAARMADM